VHNRVRRRRRPALPRRGHRLARRAGTSHLFVKNIQFPFLIINTYTRTYNTQTQASPYGPRTHVIKGAFAPGAAGDSVDALCPVWRDPEAAAAGTAGERAFRYLHDAFRPCPAPLGPGPFQLLGLHEVSLFVFFW
jgi:hypothetical protein